MGPFTKGPSSLNPMYAGVSPVASINGAIRHRGAMLTGIEVVALLTASVQVNDLSPKSLGTFIVNSPHPRPGRKCVGWPWRSEERRVGKEWAPREQLVPR